MSGRLVRKYGIYGPYKNFSIEHYGEVLHGKLLNRSDEGFSKYSEMSLLNFALTVHQVFKFNGVRANIIVLRYIFLPRFFEKRTRHDVMIYISYVLEGA